MTRGPQLKCRLLTEERVGGKTCAQLSEGKMSEGRRMENLIIAENEDVTPFIVDHRRNDR